MELVTHRQEVEILDNAATARLARELRLEAGITVRQMAKRMGWSAGYVSDLLLGRRVWSQRAASRFTKALEKGTVVTNAAPSEPSNTEAVTKAYVDAVIAASHELIDEKLNRESDDGL